MNFKSFEIEDVERIGKHLSIEGEYSCEAAFINLFIWQGIYKNSFALFDDILIVKSIGELGDSYSLPFCSDIKRGMDKIIEINNGKLPIVWAQKGKRFEKFKALYGQLYDIEESRNEADYIYLREALAGLSGKKYHSKRNHISAFSKKFSWDYAPISRDNADAVLECAELWYAENSDRSDEGMLCEQRSLKAIIENMEKLNAKGGVISVDGRIVAFCLGSPVNSETFAVHTEKALKDYMGAYSVINREFAKNALEDFKYINREDDLGIEGLRQAKLSYHPYIILEKYACIPK